MKLLNMIYYDDRACGTGKTSQALEAICQQGGKHLYALDKTEAADERIAKIREESKGRVATETIFATENHRWSGQSVCSRIERLPGDVRANGDFVVFITHEALKLANFEEFRDRGWTLWIDEVPSVLDTNKHRFSWSWTLLDQLYELHPIGSSNRSRVTLREGAPDIATLAQDDALQILRPFHRRVSDPRREVIVNLRSWEELSIKGKDVAWHSLWSPDELSCFDTVFMLGNALTDSITYRLWREKFPDLTWRPMAATSPPFLPRRVTITYFAESHRASTGLFTSSEGNSNLTAIAQHLGKRFPGDFHIWMCNATNSHALTEMPGANLSPKKAGSNSFAYAHQVTALYAAKPNSELRAIYRDLGVEPEHHTVWCECETILQFVCRSSIRKSGDASNVEIFVYDLVQAEYLLDHFQNDPRGHITAELVLENLGFAFDVRDSRPGRKKPLLTLEEIAEKKAAARDKDRLRKRAKRAELKAEDADKAARKAA